MAHTYLHIHLISDSTGETLTAIARAAMAQFEQTIAIEHYHTMVRNSQQLDRAITEIEAEPGIVMHTIVDKELSNQIEYHCKKLRLPSLPVLQPVFDIFQSYLNTTVSYRTGGQHALDADYFRRIDALNFSLAHDDGQLPEDIDTADIIIIGISRTSKTPTSMYLANRGLKVANVPLVPNIPPSPVLATANKTFVVGLIASAERIAQIRENRLSSLNATDENTDYVDRRLISNEIIQSKKLCRQNGWPIIDVSRKSIEETAAEIYTKYRTHLEDFQTKQHQDQ